ncbi:MAG: hypothetical protein ACI9YE_003890 [Psychroserpens sp.]|jgi:hypothetical protein
MRNKLAEMKKLKDEMEYFNAWAKGKSQDATNKEFAKFMNKGKTPYPARKEAVVASLSDIEAYLLTKRKVLYIPATLTNPFFMEYESIGQYTTKAACLNFPKKMQRKPDLDLSGASETEHQAIIDMINAVNKNRLIPSEQKYTVWISPIRLSLQSKPIKNSFAIKINFPDGSQTCFLYLAGRFHIATNIPE